MPDHAHVTAFLAAALVLAVTPGPGIFYVLARSLGEGTRVGRALDPGDGPGRAVPRRRRRARALDAAHDLGHRLRGRPLRGRLLPRLPGRPHAARPARAGRRDAARAGRQRLPPGRHDRAAQPEDRALLPDLPAAVRPARARPRGAAAPGARHGQRGAQLVGRPRRRGARRTCPLRPARGLALGAPPASVVGVALIALGGYAAAADRAARLRASRARAPRPRARPRRRGRCAPRRPSCPSRAGGRSPSSAPGR